MNFGGDGSVFTRESSDPVAWAWSNRSVRAELFDGSNTFCCRHARANARADLIVSKPELSFWTSFEPVVGCGSGVASETSDLREELAERCLGLATVCFKWTVASRHFSQTARLVERSGSRISNLQIVQRIKSGVFWVYHVAS